MIPESKKYLALIAMIFSISACSKAATGSGEPTAVTNSGAGTADSIQAADGEADAGFSNQLDRALAAAEFPPELSRRIRETALAGPSFILDMLAALEGDPYRWILVDKQHSLPEGYEPEDLVELTGPSYRADRKLLLRSSAAEALETMAAAAKAEGITLAASSTYRSYKYQVEVYARNVRESGQAEADRVSARPGRSQHQLGMVADFGSITDAFAGTPAGRWVAANASRFGWSLSFPQGYEELTGYRWESWHYRYVGRELTYFIDTYFEGIQQYALRFIHEWIAAET